MAVGCNTVFLGVELVELPDILRDNADFHAVACANGQLIFNLLHLPELRKFVQHQKKPLLDHVGCSPAFPEVHVPDKLAHHGADKQSCERPQLLNIVGLQHKIERNCLLGV